MGLLFIILFFWIVFPAILVVLWQYDNVKIVVRLMTKLDQRFQTIRAIVVAAFWGTVIGAILVSAIHEIISPMFPDKHIPQIIIVGIRGSLIFCMFRAMNFAVKEEAKKLRQMDGS